MRRAAAPRRGGGFRMHIGKVVGTVVATRKSEKLTGTKLLVVKQIGLDGSDTGPFVVAVDAVGAGTGEVVLYASGSSARQTATTKDTPTDAVIMAIIDSIEVGGRVVYSKP
jgi:microcompartment protein CcmK/EutM